MMSTFFDPPCLTFHFWQPQVLGCMLSCHGLLLDTRMIRLRRSNVYWAHQGLLSGPSQTLSVRSRWSRALHQVADNQKQRVEKDETFSTLAQDLSMKMKLPPEQIWPEHTLHEPLKSIEHSCWHEAFAVAEEISTILMSLTLHKCWKD